MIYRRDPGAPFFTLDLVDDVLEVICFAHLYREATEQPDEPEKLRLCFTEPELRDLLRRFAPTAPQELSGEWPGDESQGQRNAPA